jgi:hypothetical protein
MFSRQCFGTLEPLLLNTIDNPSFLAFYNRLDGGYHVTAFHRWIQLEKTARTVNAHGSRDKGDPKISSLIRR